MDDRRWPTYSSRNITLDSYVREGAPAGRGSFHVRDTAGKLYLDAINGIGCLPLGHGDPRWNAAIEAQMGKLVSAPGTIWTDPQQALARDLVKRVPVQDGRVFFGNTGTEVTEAAVKLATRATGRDVIIAFEKAFHGRTLAAIAMTANPKYRDSYVQVLDEAPLGPRFAQMNVARAPFGDLAAVETLFRRYSGRVAMVCVEPIQGEGGVNPGSREFLVGLRRLCNEHGALLGLDEIQCGVGRTGAFSAWTTLVGDDRELDADIVWYAKALGGGFPIAACVARADLAEVMTKGSHGSTFGGNPLACAAAIATLGIMDGDGLFASAGEQLGVLQSIAAEEPISGVLEVRGAGAMIGIEFGDADRALALVDTMQDLGVLVTISGGTAVRCLLAYHAGEAELCEVWTAIRRGLS